MAYFRGPNIVKDGLVLALDAANPKSYPGTGTTWNDLSGNGNHGTLVNGPTFDSGNAGSIVFDGVNDNVDINLNLLNNIDINQGTIEFFIKTEVGLQNDALLGFWDSTVFNTERGGIGMGDSTGTYSDELFSYYCLGSNVMFGIVARDSSVTSEYSLLDGNYHHIAVVIEPNNHAMYLDGLSQQFSYRLGNASTTNSFLNLANLDIIRLGVDGYNGGRFFYNGNIFSCKIYNRALTAQEIQQNYNATKSRFNL